MRTEKQTELEPEEIAAIATAVAHHLAPLLAVERGAPSKDVLDVPEAADYLRVEESWIYKQAQYKAIPYVKVGKYLRFRRKDLDRWLAEQSVPAVSTPYPKMETARSAAKRRLEARKKAA